MLCVLREVTYADVMFIQKVPGTEGLPVHSGPPPYDPRQQGPNQTANFETTFDVNGQIETISNQEQAYPKM